MCLGTFSHRGAVASATIYPCAECASSRSVFIVWKRSFLYDEKKGREASLNPMKSFLALSSVSRPDPYFSENVTCYTLYFIL